MEWSGAGVRGEDNREWKKSGFIRTRQEESV